MDAERRAGPPGRRLLAVLAVLVVSGLGSAAGVLLLGQQTSRVGPVEVALSVRPDWGGGARLQVPPLGSMSFDSHSGPLALEASVVELRPDVARELASDPGGFQTLGDRAGGDLRAALLGLIGRAVAGALLITALLALVAFRSVRAMLVCSSVVLSGAVASGVAGAATFRSDSLREPRYTGLLTSAPTAIGDARSIADNFSAYRKSLAQLVGNVVELYDVTSALPTFQPGSETVAILHVSDLHLNPAGLDLIDSLVDRFDVQAVLDTGDLTDFGSAAEGQFVQRIGRVKAPYVVVQGNHDSTTTVESLRRLPNVQVLDNEVTEVAGIRVAGIADPRFTPDKETRNAPDDAVLRSGEELARTVAGQIGFVGVAMAHDPAAAPALDGLVPLVLSGHRHRSSSKVKRTTLRLISGSTGGAGLRGLEGEEPTPLSAAILYFDPVTDLLLAWDEVEVGGLGTTSITVRRQLRPAEAAFVGPALAPQPQRTP